MKNFALRSVQATEVQEQTALFQWAAIEARRDARLRLLNASQNGLPSSIQAAARAKKAGMKKGVPDISLPVAVVPYHGLFIEMKRVGATPCHVSPEQSWWLEQLTREGYRAVVAYGWQDAAEIITVYLSGK